MNLSWIVPRGEGGHARDVDTNDRALLLREGYEEFRLTCTTPSATREGSLYVQAWTGAEEFALDVEKGGLALFGGCTTMQVHRPGSAAVVPFPHSALATEMGKSAMRE